MLPFIQYTSGKYDMASRKAILGRLSSSKMIGFNDVFDLKCALSGIMKL